MAKTVGVISEPAVVLQGVERSVKYWAVVASDGLWQYISIEQLQQKVETYLLVLSKQSEQGMFCIVNGPFNRGINVDKSISIT